jgi:formate dehydrogenase major subunit
MSLFQRIPYFRPRFNKPAKTSRSAVKRTVCTFCSCGCGMLAFVKEGKLRSLEGDYDNPINEGTLCSKGAAAGELARHGDRLVRPLHRGPGGGEWQPVEWDWALDRITEKIIELRRESWLDREDLLGQELPANRTDAIAFIGGAINTNEEAYLYKKMATLLGTYYVEHQARI